MAQVGTKDGVHAEDGDDAVGRSRPRTVERRAEQGGHGVAHVDGGSHLVRAAHVADPGRDGERQARHRPSPAQTVPHRRQQPLRQLLRPVHGNLPRPMPHGRIGEARQQCLGIGAEVHSRRRWHDGDDLVPQRLGVAAEHRVGDCVRNRLMPGQVAEVGQRRMRPVQHPQLHVLEGRDVCHELGTGLLPGWAAKRTEPVLNDPLPEGFVADRGGIHQPGRGKRVLLVHVRRGGNYPVDHGRREADMVRNPLGQGAVTDGGEIAHQPGQHAAVPRQVVAAQDGEGRHAGCAPRRQGGHQEADRRTGRGRVSEVVHDVRVPVVEPPGRWVVAVALLGDRETDDAASRFCHGGHDPGRVLRRHQ